MYQEPQIISLTQISYLVNNLTKKNFAQNCGIIRQIVETFGLESDRHYLRCLFSAINFAEPQSTPLHCKLLEQELNSQLTKPAFISNICFAIDNCFPNQKTLKTTTSLIPQICKATQGSKLLEVVLALALSHSSNTELAKYATENLKRYLPALIESYIDNETQSEKFNDISPDLLQLILSLLSTRSGFNSDLYKKFVEKLRQEFPRKRAPLILIPYLYPNFEDQKALVATVVKNIQEITNSISVTTSNTTSTSTNSTTSGSNITNSLAVGTGKTYRETGVVDFVVDLVNDEDIYDFDILKTSNIMDTSWVSLILEIGYDFTANLEDCKNHLRDKFGREIQALDVAKIIGLMCRTHTSLLDYNVNLPTPANFWQQNQQGQQSSNNSNNGTPAGTGQQADGNANPTEKKEKSGSDSTQTWKPDIFVQALKETVPNLNWQDVCLGLDHHEFQIKDRIGLNLLLTIVRLASGHNFPVECIYRHWQNVEGQFSLISTILKCSDLYSFADNIYQPVPVELLKTPPETDNKEIAQWKSMHLVDVLLYIADHGYYAQVHEIFKFPAQHCPDVLFLAMLHINPPLTAFRQDLFSNLIPTFLNNHPNSGVIFHHAWNSSNFSHTLRPIIMHCMSEWYLRGESDQTKLSRILDVAQDLKALSSLLNARSFSFVIDLACLASRREYLKLEKWVNDKLREHGEPFVQALIKFLQRRCPQLAGGKIPDDQMPKVAQLPQESISVILTCLQNCVTTVSVELADIILQMTNSCNVIANKVRQPIVPPMQQQPVVPPVQGPPPPGVLRQHRGIDPSPFSANLNAAQQMFGVAGAGGPSPLDALTGLNNSMAGLNLGGGPNGGQFNFGNVLGNLVSTPGSPSRLLSAPPPSSSPFPMMTMPNPPPNVNNLGRIQPTPPTADKMHLPSTPSVIPDLAQTVSKEVEDEANSYFQRIYNHPPHPTLSIDDVLDMLQRFKDSTIRREQEVYQCMLRNLFEEYRFFPQYPDKELQITAQLFGGIIERNLVPTFVALGLALRCVLDALRKPEGSKMYYFGITALDRFKSRLHQYNKYCEYVRSIPHFQDFPPHLIQYVEYGFQSLEPPTKPQGPVLPPSMAHILPGATGIASTGTTGPGPVPESLYRSSSVTGNIITTPTQQPKSVIASQPLHASRVKSIATATNIDTLLSANQEREEKITIPPDNIQDKTAFIFNNLSQLNLQQKCDEIKEIMTKEYWAWLSQYMVLKRASIELNFHNLYSNFLDALKNNEILRLVTRETFRNIRVLLRSDKGIANFSDRSLLKNLGHWLGMLTLGRSRPILMLDLDLKSLLVEAYHKGQQELLYVVPFVAKVLESCSKSKVFKPPNPWTMAIMNVLAELHTEQDLKLNLKFEIEVLCKTLNIDISELKPIIYLKDAERILNIEFQLSQPKPKEIPAQPKPPVPQQPSTPQIPQQEDHQNIANPSPSGVNNDTGNMGQVPITPPEPRFSYLDINVTNVASIQQHIILSQAIGILHTNPALKAVALSAIEKTISDWLPPVVERSVRIAVATSEQIVRKDFALDPDDQKMRVAAHFMVRNLAAGMAMITCRDQLSATIVANIKKAFQTLINSPQQIQEIDNAAQQIAADNVDLVCAFIQKTASEKSIPESDRRLAQDFDLRKLAREEGRRYCDPEAAAYQNDRMPEQVRLSVSGIPSTQFAVYEEFARNIPGFQLMAEREMSMLMPKAAIPETFTATDEYAIMYAEVAAKMEAFLNAAVNVPTLQLQATKINAVLNACLLVRRNREQEHCLSLLTRAVEALIEGLVNIPDQVEQMKLYRDINLRILNILHHQFGAPAIEHTVTNCVFEIREELRYNVEAIKLLINSHFINVSQFDQMLCQKMDNGANYLAVTFAMQLVQHYLVDERSSGNVNESEFCNSIDLLARLGAHHRGPEGLAHLIELLRINHDPNSFLIERNIATPSQYIQSGILHVRSNDCDDPPGLQEKTEILLKDWVQIHLSQQHGRDTVKTFSTFVNKMNLYGILKTDDLITRFFRQATQFCIDYVYRLINDPSTNAVVTKAKIFQFIDAFVRLIALLVRHSGDQNNPSTKINLLNKVLGIVLGVLLQDQEMHGTAFQQVGYHRFFIMLFLELSSSDLEHLMHNIVIAFCHTYHLLNPAMAPGFCYSWLELISHRVFIGRILAQIPQQKGWPLYSQLLLDLFKYLAPFLRNAELAKPVQLLYKGTLRVLLVLLHDFPEFLCDYHFGFCDVIPPNCIQMRNIILAAFPRNMRLPDPFTPNLKVDMLQETATAPRIYTNYIINIQPLGFKKDLDSYLKARAPVTFLSELRSHLQISNEPGSRYNISLMNALVLYVGNQAIAHIRNKNSVPNTSTIVHSAHMDIFQNLAVDLDNEGRYLFLNAIANQLRYPNSHTHYFSCVLLYLFAEANSEAIQEQITRVLLERLIVNRPHPWGLLITFIELIKNRVYKFWDHDFVHCAPEIEKLFESVARSCMVKANHQQQIITNVEPELQECN
ncbi:CCR4-NOT transcription complex subunit 1 [Condylostylus longicornis]|uniref:CCR4-NOT transcription complex subunit 1 n=1 Tax=Condylostylus longicornis TaxID=2530218 RepID=UPI00244E2A7B|nr:CCR4-NOT transcription complex subunit 1 [Condylostylus longicornis]